MTPVQIGILLTIALSGLVLLSGDAAPGTGAGPEPSSPSKKTWSLANWSEAAKAAGKTLIPPPGIPIGVRLPSAEGAAYPLIYDAASSIGTPSFAALMVALAEHESGGRLAMPAWKYKDSPPGQVTAWGTFQPLAGVAKTYFGHSRSWEMTVGEEVNGMVAIYWSKMAELGMLPESALLWHLESTTWKKARDLYQIGFPPAQAIAEIVKTDISASTWKKYTEMAKAAGVAIVVS